MGYFKSIRNGLISFFTIFFVLVFFAHDLKASHGAGGYLRLVCVDAATNTYKVVLTWYRDITGQGAPGDWTIHVDAVNSSEAPDQQFTTFPHLPMDTVPTVKTGPCHSPPEVPYDVVQYGEYIYETPTFTLPPAPSGFNIYTGSFCCRNAEIDNITSNGQRFFLRTADRQEFPCNSSPKFVNYPPTEICVGDTLEFDYSAYDPNGGIDTSTVSITETPQNGTVTFNPNNGQFEYVPDPGFVGKDSFSYEACDISVSFTPDCDEATVYIDVAYENFPPQATDDIMLTIEGTSVSKNLIANDDDFDGSLNPNSLKVLQNPNNGDLFSQAAGIMQYYPDDGFTGIDSFTYSVCDLGNPQLCDTANVYVTVAASIDPPLAVDDYITFSAQSVNIDVLGNDDAFSYNLDNSTLEIIEEPTNANAASVLVNKLYYLAKNKYSGLDSLKYQVCNDQSPASCDSATVYITREAQDFPPFAVPDTFRMAANTTGNIDVLSNDIDKTETLPYSGVSVAGTPFHGTTNVTGSGIEYTPPAGYVGIDSFMYRICDGGNQNYCDRAMVYVLVENENYKPYAFDDKYLLDFNTGGTFDVTQNDLDREGALASNGSLQIISGPDHGTATVNGLQIDYDPDNGFNGIDELEYEICDNGTPNQCDTATVTFFVQPDNYLPFVGADTAIPYCFDPVNINVLENDQVIGEDFNLSTLSVITPPANGTANVTGDSIITYEADSGFVGMDSLFYEVCDDNGDCESNVIYINWDQINLPPDARTDRTTINANSYAIMDLLANDQDPEGALAPGSFQLITDPSNGQIYLSQQGEMLYEPNSGFTGVDSFTYQVCDDGIPSRCDQAKIYITVGGSTPPQAIDDNFTISSFGPSSINVLTNDAAASGALDNRTLSLLSSPDYGEIYIDYRNRFVYYPTDSSPTGTDQFTYSICNTATPIACDDATVTIDLVYNQAPSVEDDNIEVAYGKPYFFDPLANDSDADGELRFETAEIVTPPSNGEIFIHADSGMVYVPDDYYSGTDQFEYKVCDDGMAIKCQTATVNITVKANDKPQASDDSRNVRFNAPDMVNVASNDTDPSGDLDASSVRVITPPSNGNAAVDKEGSVFYQPNTDYLGVDSFEYLIADHANPLQTDTAWVYLEVGFDPAENLAFPDFHAFNQNQYGIFSLAANDDPSIDYSTFKIVDYAHHGDATILPTGEVYYTPDTNFTGTDSMRYLVCQSPLRYNCDTAVVKFTMGDVEFPITANNDQADVYEDHYRDVYVLENDVDKDRYTAGYNLGIVTGPTKGTATVIDNEFIRYNANAGATGTDNFVYEVCDGLGCDQATVNINIVSGQNIAPTVLNDRYEIIQGKTTKFNILSNDIDPDQDSLAYRLCSALDDGTYTRANMPPFPLATYAAGYSPTNPVVANPPMEIDPVTGMLTGVPTQVSTCVITVCVEEYKNGRFLSDTRSEVQIKFANCTKVPDASIDTTIMENGGSGGGGGSLQNTILVCDGRTVDFQHMSDSINDYEYYWDFGLPNVTNDTSHAENPSFTYPDTGTYLAKLIVAPGAACESVDSAYVKIYDSPEANFTFDEPLCRDQEIQFHDVSDPVNKDITDWQWQFSATNIKSGQQPTNIYNSTGSKSVTLTVLSETGCSDDTTRQFNINPSPVVDLPNDVQQVCVNDTVTLEAQHTPGVTSLEWMPKTDLQMTNDPAVVKVYRDNPGGRQYTATATNQHGCEVSESVIFNAIPRPSVSAQGPLRLCLKDFVNMDVQPQGTVQFPPDFQWEPAAGLSSPTIANPLANPDTTTTYTVTLSKDNGKYCIEQDTVTVYTELPEVEIEPEKPILCANDFTQLNVKTNTDRATYSWSPTASLSDPNIRFPIASPTASTPYTLTLYDSITKCTVYDTVDLTVKQVTGLDAGPDTTICKGDTTTLQASDGSRFIWKQDTTLNCQCCAQPKAFPQEQTTYTLTGLDSNGCKSSDSVTVSIVPKPEFEISEDTIVCPGEQVDVGVSGTTVSYIWYEDQSKNCSSCSSIPVTAQDSNSYVVGGVSDKGCIVLDTVTIDVFPPPETGSSTPPALCRGDTAQLEITGAATYNWSPDSTLTDPTIANPLAYPRINTDYVVEGLDVNGCNYSDTVEVTVNALQDGSAAFIGDTSVCIGDSIMLFAEGFSEYSWSPSSNLSCDSCPTPMAAPTNATTYEVIVADSNGCKDTADFTVGVNPLPVITLDVPEDSFCVGESVQLTAGGGTDYSWDPALGLDDATVNNPVAEPPAGSIEYSLTVTNNNGCVEDTTQQLEVHELPTTEAGADTAICYLDTAQLSASGAETYEWKGGASGEISCTDCPDPKVWPSNTTMYTLTGYNEFGCVFEDTVEVQVNPEPGSVTKSNDTTICQGDSIELTVSGGNSYEWLPTQSLSCETCPDPIAKPTSDETFVVRVYTNAGCYRDFEVDVDVQELPQAGVTADTGVCITNSVALEATGGTNYQWNPPTGLSNPNVADPEATPSDPTNYTVTISDDLGCSVQDSVFVDIYVPKDPNAQPDTLICANEPITVSAENGESYNWSPAGIFEDPTAASSTVVLEESQEMVVEITDDNNCYNSDTIFADVKPIPTITTSDDITIYEGSSATLTVQGTDSYVWEPTTGMVDSAGNYITVIPEDTVLYTVTGYSEFGCKTVDSILVSPIPEMDVYVPNAFTPNNDGENDRFVVKSNVDYELVSLKIFDRWGNVIFSTDTPSEGWDGNVGGEPMPIGTYVYTLKVRDAIGETIEKQGNFVLIR